MTRLFPRIDTFRNALKGIKVLLKSEVNFRVHIISFIIVIIAAVALKLDTQEWIIILIVSSIVMAAEALNTSIEKLCDRIIPQEDQAIKQLKDISAGAVLITAISALIIGLLIFIPKIF